MITAGGDMNKVIAWEGVSNRINEITNGFLYYGEEFELEWIINRHCPFKYDEIFQPIEGVTVVERATEETFWGSLHKGQGYISYWYIGSHHDSGPLWDKAQINAAHEKVLRSFMPIKQWGYDLGIHYRRFGTSCCDLDYFCEQAKGLMKPTDVVFVLADCSRDIIKERLENHCKVLAFGKSREMKHDADREGWDDMWHFCRELSILNYIDTIITSSSVSTMTDVARGRGKTIYHCGVTRDDPSCWFVSHDKESFKQL